jgi:3-isopropylmalate/(R)-2-methylmalate dehydratase small subunit
MKIEEKIWKFGDNIDTDQIIPTQYLTLASLKEMAKFTMEPTRKEFAQEYKAGNIVVGGKNFGCGSSREQAPSVLKELGVKIVIAESFARIFFRNSINLGILLIELESTKDFQDKDIVIIDIDNSEVINKTKNKTFKIIPISDFLKEIIQKGGLVNYLKG